jgi:WD40 repeat protein
MLQSQSTQASHDPLVEFADNGLGTAYVEPVGSRFRVVHNGIPGNPFYVIGDLSLSKDGKRVAYIGHISDTLRRVVVDTAEGPLYGEIGSPLFTPDGRHVVYTITKEKKSYLVVDHKVHDELPIEQDLLLSPDSRYVAFATSPKPGEKRRFIISDLALQDKVELESCGQMYLASEDRTRIATVCSDGGKRSIKIVDFVNRSVVETISTPPDGNLYHLRFGPDNRSFAAGLIKDNMNRFILYNGRIEKTPEGEELLSDPLVLSNPDRVGVIIGIATNAHLYNAFSTSKPIDTAYGFTSEFAASKDGRHYAYVAIKAGGEERMRVVVDGHEGPLFDKAVSPVFSPDGRYLVYRARQGGKRFLVVSDTKGVVVRQHRNYDMVFQPTFTPDGKSVAYGVLDGKELWWKVEKL